MKPESMLGLDDVWKILQAPAYCITGKTETEGG